MYKLYDNKTKKFFLHQDGRDIAWDSEGTGMDKVDAKIRMAIILKNYPELKHRLVMYKLK